MIHHDHSSLVGGFDPALIIIIIIITRKLLPAVKMEGLDPELEEVMEALNAANNDSNPTATLTKNDKLFNSLVAECQVRVKS